VDLPQPAFQALRETLRQRQSGTADGQQHGGASDHVLQQVAALAPGAEEAIKQRQQQAAQVKHQRRVCAHLAVLAVVIGLGVEKEVGEVDHHQQRQLALASVDHAEGAAE
jgi:hypothetical protein